MTKSIKFGGGVLPSVKQRNSNLELLRILSMLVIVAHHLVVNSGVRDLFAIDNGLTVNALYLQLFGMWGKTAINTFIMISGYFMCKSKMTAKRFSKVYLESKFYVVVLFAIFLITGFENLGLSRLVNVLFGFQRNANNGFVSSFIVFYLFIPFYNKLIEAMDEKMHRWLVIIFICVMSVFPTVLFNSSVAPEISWYIVIYFVAAYIRIYPMDWMKNNKICVPILLVSILLAIASIILVDTLGVRFGFTTAYYLLTDSNKVLAFVIGVFSFLVFNNIKIPYNKFINTVASTTYGVLLIHANGDAMRQLLWDDILDIKGHYSLALPQLMLFTIGSTIAIFTVCSLIDLIRINLIEKPVFKWLDKFEWFNKPIF